MTEYEPPDNADEAVQYLKKAVEAACDADSGAGLPWDHTNRDATILSLAANVAQEHPEYFQHPSPELTTTEKLRAVINEIDSAERKAFNVGYKRGTSERNQHISQWLHDTGFKKAAAAVRGHFK